MTLDPVLQAIYSTVFDAAPFVIAAYALLWIGLMGYVALTMRRVGQVEKQLTILEDAIERRNLKDKA